MTTTALSGPIDVHMVTHEHARKGRRRLAAAGGLTVRRQLAGFAVAAAGLPLVTAALAGLRGQLSLPSDILMVLLVVVAAAITGGFWPGITAAVAGFLLLNYYFTEPYHTFAMSHPTTWSPWRCSWPSPRRSAPWSGWPPGAAGTPPGPEPTPSCYSTSRATSCAASTRSPHCWRGSARPSPRNRSPCSNTGPGTPLTPARQRDPECWQVAAAVGGKPCAAPDEGDTDIPVGEDLALVLRGRPLPAAHRSERNQGRNQLVTWPGRDPQDTPYRPRRLRRPEVSSVTSVILSARANSR